ncbi:hypothetical protein K8R66_01665 [bacterium]|nr:hypothetical protein [bacterium]
MFDMLIVFVPLLQIQTADLIFIKSADSYKISSFSLEKEAILETLWNIIDDSQHFFMIMKELLHREMMIHKRIIREYCHGG